MFSILQPLKRVNWIDNDDILLWSVVKYSPIIIFHQVMPVIQHLNLLPNRSIHSTAACLKTQAGKYKITRRREFPLTYEMANPPHRIQHRKTWNSFNCGMYYPHEWVRSASLTWVISKLQQTCRMVCGHRKRPSRICSSVNSLSAHFMDLLRPKSSSNDNSITFESRACSLENCNRANYTSWSVIRRNCLRCGCNVPSPWRFKPLKIAKKLFTNTFKFVVILWLFGTIISIEIA